MNSLSSSAAIANPLVRPRIEQHPDGQRAGLMQAIGERRFDDVRAFINATHSRVTDDNELALRVTIEEGCLPLALEILSKNNLSPQEKERALFLAAEKGYLDVVQVFIRDGLPDRRRGSAIQEAARGGHLEVVDALLKSGPISDDARGEAVKAAAKNGFLRVVRALLASGAISDDARGEAVKAAARGWNLGGVRARWASGWISERGRHLEVVRALFASGAISDGARRATVEFAAERGNLAIVQVLLPRGIRLSQGDREWIILSVSSSGHRDVLEFFLHQGPISESVRNSAITQARGPLAGEIRDMLIMAPVILNVASVPDLIAEGPSVEKTLYTNFNEVKEDPARFLEIVTDRFPRRVVLTDNPEAIDLGGVTKQLISTLIDALCEKKVIGRNDKLIPIIRTEEDYTQLQRIAKFYSLIFEKNQGRSNKFVIGNLFHSRFFDLVKIAIGDTSEEEKIKSIARVIAKIDPAFKIAATCLVSPTVETRKEYCDFMGLETIDETDLKAPFEQFLLAATEFAKGLSRKFKVELLTKDSISLMNLIQGEDVAAQKLLNAIKFEGEGEDFIQKKNWIIAKIAEDDKEWIRKLLFSITGSGTLSNTLRLRIKSSWRNLFELHTCFDSLDLPTSPMTQAEFLAALESAIDGNGYNTV